MKDRAEGTGEVVKAVKRIGRGGSLGRLWIDSV